jgi:hypothetical protein
MIELVLNVICVLFEDLLELNACSERKSVP